MDLVNELGSELVLAFLVEKKHSDKIDLKKALNLINKVQDILQSTAGERPVVTPDPTPIAGSAVPKTAG